MTKAERDEAQFVALRQRVADAATGAAGFEFDVDSEWANAEILSRLIPALQVIFGDDGNKHLWMPGNLHHFNDVDSITNFLWDHKIRA